MKCDLVRSTDAAKGIVTMIFQHALRGIVGLLLLGCSRGNTAGTTDEGSAGTANRGTRCAPASGTTGGPRTIYQLLELVNGLPRPVELPCLVESLDRPLALNANFNTQSAQPAAGKRSPRIFIIIDESLSLSLVPGGSTLEFGERGADAADVSVKGELHFPVERELFPEDAFARLAPDESTGLTLYEATSCGVCHDNETPARDYPFRGAFASAVVRPAPFFAVDVAAIRRERDICDATTEPERCAVLEAMFDHGDVVETAFP